MFILATDIMSNKTAIRIDLISRIYSYSSSETKDITVIEFIDGSKEYVKESVLQLYECLENKYSYKVD